MKHKISFSGIKATVDLQKTLYKHTKILLLSPRSLNDPKQNPLVCENIHHVIPKYMQSFITHAKNSALLTYYLINKSID